VLMVKAGKAAPSVTVYPNPVTAQNATLQFSNMEKGIYQLQLLNTAGQPVLVQQLQHAGNNAAWTLLPGKELAAGNYFLELTQPDHSKTVSIIRISN